MRRKKGLRKSSTEGRRVRAAGAMKGSLQPGLPEIEGHLRQLLGNINEGVVIQDKSHYITYANDKFLRLVGYRRNEVIGRPITALLGRGWLRKDRADRAGAAKDPWKSAEISWKRKDGKTVFTILSPKPLYDQQGQFGGTLAVLTDITDRRKVEIELRRSREELRSLSRYLESVRERESKRIAGEIHDVLGQQLTALRIDLSWLTERFRSGEKDSGKILGRLNAMFDLIDQTIKVVQKISAELRPGLLDDLGLLPALEWLSQDFESRTKIKCRTNFDRDDIPLDPDFATAVFRVSQEALTNVVRHAEATQVQIGLKEENGALVLTIKDNGKGIKKPRIWDPSSLGILGMRERVRRFNGEFRISGAPQKGTTLTAVFPREAD
jgi:two-component system sensor histidine kinase UhpB